MVNIDTVYQRVLALANKEQRGYITPQEFNLFANQAQVEIFEQYFYDLNQFARIPGNEYVYADIDDMLEEKIQIFEFVDGANAVNGYQNAGGGGIFKRIPDYIYRIHRIEFDNINCEIQKTKDFNDCRWGGGLTRPTNDRPVANIRANIMRVIGDNGNPIMPTGVFYFRIPVTVSWGYFVINDKALYDGDNNKTTHFELHPSEEVELVYKILRLAGVSMKRDDILKAGQGLDTVQNQQEKQ
tara:strand:+ start:219 stop:941 length:723 start_codon:yes stop_codon:yes gene_type:complete